MLKPIAALAIILATAACTSTPAEAPQAAATSTTWNAAVLQEVVAYAQSQKTTGFLIIHDGKTITENNWPLPDDAASQAFRANFVHGQTTSGELREDVASQQKSFVAVLVGIGIDKGLVDIEKPVSAYLGAGWSKATPEQEAAITVRNLMEMNSGLKENLSYESPPGTAFFYNTPAYAILKPVLQKASGQSLAALTEAWLTKPIGMKDTAWEQRPSSLGDVGNPTGLVTTPRDIARFGQLVLDGGRSNGAAIISKQQLDALFVRTTTNPAYGHLWWLNGSDTTLNVGPGAPRRSGQLVPSAPRDMVAALGAADRKLFVVPSMKLLVVRTGQTAPEKGFDEKLWQLLARAMPQH